MTQTGLTSRLYLTVMAPVMDQMNRGCHNGKEGAGSGTTIIPYIFICGESSHTHIQMLSLNDRKWQTARPGMTDGERHRIRPPSPLELRQQRNNKRQQKKHNILLQCTDAVTGRVKAHKVVHTPV